VSGAGQLKDIIEQTVVVRFPRHRLATFGDSDIRYYLITPHADADDRSILRTGRVSALRPKILTPESFQSYFEGFGEDAEGYEKLLKDNFADSFRGLEYTFQNKLENREERHVGPDDLARTLGRDLDDRSATREAVLRGPENGWSLSLMKFALEEAGRSFPVNMRELDERGLFDPGAAALNRRKGEIERLFRDAASDATLRPVLAARLKEYGLFDDYQDRFFRLIRP
jgi:hypothetical protein